MVVSEKLKIEAASLTTGATPEAKLYVRNLVGDAVKVVHAYILRPGSTSAICSKQLTTTINAGEMSPVTFTLTTATDCTGSIEAGRDYVIKIVTQKGSGSKYLTNLSLSIGSLGGWFLPSQSP
jgi:hypothetical protein